MIVPRYRLLFLTALIGLPCAFISTMQPGMSLPMGCLALLFLLAVSLDALRNLPALKGIQISFLQSAQEFSAKTAAAFRLTKDRPGQIAVRVQNRAAHDYALRIGLAFPPSLVPEQAIQCIDVPKADGDFRLVWNCTPRKRGLFALQNIFVETASPWRLWDIRRTFPGHAEVRVYPNLWTERRRLAALFLNRGALGLHTQRFSGQGREFEKLREYLPGDSCEDIHWKATARRAHPVTKVYQIERTQEIYVIIDASRLSARIALEPAAHPSGGAEPTTDEKSYEADDIAVPQLDRFIKAALMLEQAAEKQGDLFGLAAFSDRVHHFVRAAGGRSHFNVCRDALYRLESHGVNPDFEELCTFLHTRLRRRALLVFLTNLDDPVLADHFMRNIRLLHRRHLILVNMLTSVGIQPLFSGADVNAVDDIYQRLGGHLQWRDLRELQLSLQRIGISMHLLKDGALTPALISQYMHVKQRQLL